MARLVLAIVALAILGSVGVAGLQAGLENAGEDRTITNESWAPDPGNVTSLKYSSQTGAYYSSNATVYNATGVEMEDGVDFEWFAGNGTVKALSGGDLDGDASAEISYQLQQTTEEQRQFVAVLGHIPRVMGFALPFGAVVFLFILVRGG